jgi:hypothetical protein
MRKLSKRVRQQRAKAEAEAHVRKFGIGDVDDWAYSIAAHWGFVDNDDFIEWVAAFMRFVNANIEAEKAARDHKQEEEEYRKWKIERERYEKTTEQWEPRGKFGRPSPPPMLTKRRFAQFEQRWQQERKKAQS